jgi:hypothetical protein
VADPNGGGTPCHNHHVSALADLLGAIAAAPKLDDAACRTHPVTFAATQGKAAGQPGVYDRAIRVCVSCPALAACSAWVTSLPVGQRPPGVTAGLIHRQTD